MPTDSRSVIETPLIGVFLTIQHGRRLVNYLPGANSLVAVMSRVEGIDDSQDVMAIQTHG